MFQTLDREVDAYVNHDELRAPREILHHQPVVTTARTAQGAALEYLRDHGHRLALPGATGLSDGPYGLQLELERTAFDSTTVSYEQTYDGIPVWRAGVAVTLRSDPLRVVSARSTARDDVQLVKPSETKVKRHLALDGARAASGIGLVSERTNGDREHVEVLSRRLVIYRYNELKRLQQREKQPGLLLEDVPKAVVHGTDRLATETILNVTRRDRALAWLVITDVETGAVLEATPFVDEVSGLVFERDPITLTGSSANAPSASSTALNPLRTTRTLSGLTPPAPGTNQQLSGSNIRITDFETPTVTPPTQPAGSSFAFDARSNDFGAVNAYYHCDEVFRLIEDLGFSLTTYFNGTTRPVPVDHRGHYGTTDGVERNASCSGNGMGGIAGVDFELADLGDTSNPISIAADYRVVLHELCGHGILYEAVNAANFGFAHSAGDSFAVILNDPDSLAPDRFESFPWVSFIGRRHDRSVTGGWAWGGSNDVGGYSSEQILATSNFRTYLAIGGGSSDPGTRRFAARVMAYLMLRAIATLTPSTNPTNVSGFVTAMQTADLGDWTSEGLSGGAYGKVIRWAFEKQGLFQPPGAPTPVTTVGAPPAVDVFIDDGRHGEYDYQPNHWSNQSVWNRRATDGGTAHEEPVLGQTNYAYVTVSNRGTQTATGVVVKGFHCQPSAGLVWPNDWQAMSTTQLTAPDIPPGGHVTVGPFAWTPVAVGHECMLMISSAVGDPSNVDNFTAGDSIPEWRLVPHDNNIGQRNVAPVPAGGIEGLITALTGRPFTVRNPFEHKAGIALDVALPAVLEKADWRVQVSSPGGAAFPLRAGTAKDVRFDLVVGRPEALERLAALPAEERELVITARADGRVIGGMTYALDPALKAEPAPREDEPNHHHHDDQDQQHDGDGRSEEACRRSASQLLHCLGEDLGDVRSVRVSRVVLDVELDC
jgi:hypothetical protein